MISRGSKVKAPAAAAAGISGSAAAGNQWPRDGLCIRQDGMGGLITTRSHCHEMLCGGDRQNTKTV